MNEKNRPNKWLRIASVFSSLVIFGVLRFGGLRKTGFHKFLE